MKVCGSLPLRPLKFMVKWEIMENHLWERLQPATGGQKMVPHYWGARLMYWAVESSMLCKSDFYDFVDVDSLLNNQAVKIV